MYNKCTILHCPDDTNTVWDYLKGTVHQSLVQVYHHTLLSVVVDVDLGEEVFLWRLVRQNTGWGWEGERVLKDNLQQLEVDVKMLTCQKERGRQQRSGSTWQNPWTKGRGHAQTGDDAGSNGCNAIVKQWSYASPCQKISTNAHVHALGNQTLAKDW